MKLLATTEEPLSAAAYKLLLSSIASIEYSEKLLSGAAYKFSSAETIHRNITAVSNKSWDNKLID